MLKIEEACGRLMSMLYIFPRVVNRNLGNGQ